MCSGRQREASLASCTGKVFHTLIYTLLVEIPLPHVAPIFHQSLVVTSRYLQAVSPYAPSTSRWAAR
jgi:hypothetical protein